MSETDTDKRFLGVGWSFPPEFHKYGDKTGVKMVAEEEDIQESLTILLSTRPGERIMQPAYGCGLHDMVFENINETTVTEIRDVIERAILFYEHRINLEGIELDTENVYEGRIDIQLDYTIRKTNTRSNVVYPFYFIEGSHVRV
ncbi:MAG: GPW/gp25 family protein [Pseudomonadota bacterium]